MPEISEECRKRLREIDRRLQAISSAAAHESPLGVAVDTAILNVRRVTGGTASLDEECKRLLRQLDPKVDAINAAVLTFQDYATIHRLVEEARASIRPGGLSGSVGVPSLG